MMYNDFVCELLQSTPVALLGFADLTQLPIGVRQGLPYGICFAIALPVLPQTEGEPNVEYYSAYREINAELKKIGVMLESAIHAKGFHAYSLMRNRQSDDFRTLLPFKTLATCAGLGWIGKSSTLITRDFGNAIRLNGVITDLPLRPDAPTTRAYCGTCTACADHCPGHAIFGRSYEPGMDRDMLIDPQACKRAVIKRGEALGVTVGSCGICLSVCPWTKKYQARGLRQPEAFTHSASFGKAHRQ